MRWDAALARGIAAGAFVCLGCAGPAQHRYEERLARAPEPAAHAIHEERLTVLMRDLDRLQHSRLPQALDPQAEAARQVREVARVARDMAESARRIPDAEPDRLEPAERDAFRALAQALWLHCDRLAEAAPRSSPEERQQRLAEIEATCASCHIRFRIPGVARGD